MQDAAELNRMLMDRMEEVAIHLFPAGKKEGNKWVVGGIDGSAGNSMQITISGSAVGRFVDFASKESKGATPLWLWSKNKGCTFPEAIKQAMEWLGVKPEDFGVRKFKQKSYQKPGKTEIKPIEPNTQVSDYLVGERRLSPIVVANAKVCDDDGGNTIVFPFIEKDPETGKMICVHRKHLRIARPDGKKDSWTTKGTKRCLYGKNLIEDSVSELVITEGEIDALSWHSWGIPAVSVPNGVLDFEWMDVDWEWLARFEKIYVAMDMDEPGKQCALDIAKRLGLHRCYIVTLPHKDANECLTEGLTKDAMETCLKLSKPIELDEIKRPDDFRKQVLDHYENDPASQGLETPWWPELPWRVRPGEFTVLSGFSGHGKTQGLNQLMLHLIQQGMKVMDASLEINSSKTLYFMSRCALAKKYSNPDEVNACITWINESMFFLDCIGTVSVDRIMHAMEYARKRHGVDVFVIDSLFKCGMSSEDYGAARAFADRLTSFCNNTGAHVILVAHSRKTQNGNELNPPSKSDVAGSSDITNAAFNVIIFWRNKMKKKKIDECRQSNTPEAVEELAKWIDQPDGRIIIDKQRFGDGEESETFTWFEKDACQFHTRQNKKIPYFEVR